MKKYVIIAIILFLGVAAAIFYLFSRNRSGFVLDSNPEQMIADQEAKPLPNVKHMLSIKSIFPNNGQIPDQYGCRGRDVNPPLQFSGIPTGTKSLALIVDDPDAPSGDWVHWLIFNMDPALAGIDEDSLPIGATFGITSAGTKDYGGPCPPSGTHHYHFKLYALDSLLKLDSQAKKADVLSAMKGHIMEQSEIVGTYSQ